MQITRAKNDESVTSQALVTKITNDSITRTSQIDRHILYIRSVCHILTHIFLIQQINEYLSIMKTDFNSHHFTTTYTKKK